MKRFLGKPLFVLIALVILVFSVVMAESFYTVIVRSNLRVGETIADTASFALGGSGEAQFSVKTFVDGGLATDMYFVSWRLDSADQVFAVPDSSFSIGVFAEADSVTFVRPDTTYNKLGKLQFFRVRQAP